MFTFLIDWGWWFIRKIGWLFIPVIGPMIWVFDNFPGLYKNMWGWVFSSVKWYFTDFYIWVFGKITVLLTSFFADNDFVVGVVEISNDTFLAINVFLPLNETMVCVSLILTTMMAVFILRIILKSIPTVW